MITRSQSRPVDYHPATARSAEVQEARASFISRVIMVWLVGIVIMLPVKIINLPFNFEMVDAWIVIGLPAAIMFFLFGPRQVVDLSYILPIWLVLMSSFLSSFTAPSAMNSLMVILKESYLFVWFLSITILLYNLKAVDLRIVLIAWACVAVLHGLLMIAQFLSPEIWRMTNALGGNAAHIEGYRASGMFICGKAGCANKAAYFQLLGFAPLLLASLPRRLTVLMGILLVVSLLTTGSMGASLAFLAGLTTIGVAIAIIKKRFLLLLKYLFWVLAALLLLGGLLFVLTTINSGYRAHFEKIIVGRFDKSSSGRLNLWQRGIDSLLEHNAFIWGVGPENFRIVDAAGADNQLHNDTLAFLVERGLIGVTGLALFAGIAARRAIMLLVLSGRSTGGVRLELVIFLAVLAATVVESLTHQMFRTRELWFVLALQEAVYFNLVKSHRPVDQPVPFSNGLEIVQQPPKQPEAAPNR